MCAFLICSLVQACMAEGTKTDKSKTCQENEIMLKITKLNMSDKSLIIGYEIKNRLKHPIWICDDINTYREWKFETRIEKKVLFVRVRFDSECNVELEAPVIARYVRLLPDANYLGEISVKLPVESYSPFHYYFFEGDERKVVQIDQAFLEVGYWEEDLPKKISEAIEILMADPNNEEDYWIGSHLKSVNKKMSDTVVFIPHFWEERRKEQGLKVELTDIKIPCIVYEPKKKE